MQIEFSKSLVQGELNLLRGVMFVFEIEANFLLK